MGRSTLWLPQYRDVGGRGRAALGPEHGQEGGEEDETVVQTKHHRQHEHLEHKEIVGVDWK